MQQKRLMHLDRLEALRAQEEDGDLGHHHHHHDHHHHHHLTMAVVSLERTIAFQNSLLSNRLLERRKGRPHNTPSLASDDSDTPTNYPDNLTQSPTIYPSIVPKSSTKQDKVGWWMDLGGGMEGGGGEWMSGWVD